MRRLEEFIRDPAVPFYIRLRFLVGQRVQEQHRRHLGTPGRDVGREVSIYRGAMPGASTGALAARLLGKLTSPSQAAIRAERKIRLQEALNRMDPLDREILVLRHYEQMTNGDAAAALGLKRAAASKRYTRALDRLRKILSIARGRRRGRVMSEQFRSRPVRGRRRIVPRAVRRRRAAEHRGTGRPLPELAEQIRRLLPALVRVEQDLSIEPDPGPPRCRFGAGPVEATARRLPHPSRDRPGWHGGRLRGRAGQPGPPGGAEGPARHVAGDSRALERFRREARAAARLHHTNIVPVFEVGQDDEAAYYAMQFIPGQGLDQVINELARLRDPAPTARWRAPGRPRTPRRPVRGGLRRAGSPVAPDGRFATEGAMPHRRRPGRRGRPGPTSAARTGCERDCPPRRLPARMASPGRGPHRPASAVLPGGAAVSRVSRRQAAVLPERGADRPPGGARAGPRPCQRHRPPRHQAVEPAARHRRRRLDRRLRPGQGRGRRADRHRRHPGHAPLHGPERFRGEGTPGRTSTRWG